MLTGKRLPPNRVKCKRCWSLGEVPDSRKPTPRQQGKCVARCARFVSITVAGLREIIWSQSTRAFIPFPASISSLSGNPIKWRGRNSLAQRFVLTPRNFAVRNVAMFAPTAQQT